MDKDMDRIIGDRETEKKILDKIKEEYGIAVHKEEMGKHIVFSVQKDGKLSALTLTSCTAAMHRNPIASAGRIPNMADIERVGTNLISAAALQEAHDDEAAAGTLLSGALAYQNQMQVPLCLVESPLPGEESLGRLGFQYIYDRPLYTLNDQTVSVKMLDRAARGENVSLDIPGVTLQAVGREELLSLAHFVNARLCRQYGIFLIRSASYYEAVQEKLRAIGGNLFQVMEHGVRKGYFAYANTGADSIREAVFDEDFDRECYLLTERGKKPAVMARIVNLPELLKHVTGNGRITVAIQIRDPVVAENDGLFIWYINEEGSRMERVEDPPAEMEKDSSMRPEVTVTIDEFTAFIFAYMKLKQNAKFDSIYLAGPAWLDGIY